MLILTDDLLSQLDALLFFLSLLFLRFCLGLFTHRRFFGLCRGDHRGIILDSLRLILI